MEYILYVFMVVTVPTNNTVYKEWIPNGEYRSKVTCETGARQLGYTSDNFKCIKK